MITSTANARRSPRYVQRTPHNPTSVQPRLTHYQNRRLISSYKSETTTKQAELDSLTTQPTVFQTRRCHSCGGTLDLPVVHFLCKHSFHERCLNRVDENAQCPACAGTNETLRAIRQRQVEAAEQHDLFKGELGRARDRFGVVSEFFGRGVMRSEATMEG